MKKKIFVYGALLASLALVGCENKKESGKESNQSTSSEASKVTKNNQLLI